jgi:FixJ family two-component response regulator
MKANTQNKERRIVLVVDDDSRLLRSLATLTRPAGVKALTFAGLTIVACTKVQ